MNTGLDVVNLSGGYGSLVVFSGLNLSVSAQETVGILGPNGAGKTTFFSTVVGLLPAIKGHITLGGDDVTSTAAYRRARKRIALVPEGRQILSTLTVADNLFLTRACDPKERTEQFSRRVQEIFDLFPRLRERSKQLGGTLSGGEQQMLAIARALLMQPKVLMLDEPTQGLAPVIVQELLGALKKLKGQFSMIVVEQNMDFLEKLSDRILPMRNGELHPALPAKFQS